MLSGELAQPATNTHHPVLGTEEPAVTTSLAAWQLSSHASETLAELSLGAEVLASSRDLLEMQKTAPDLLHNQIPQVIHDHINSWEASVSGFTSLCLSFLLCTMGITTEPTLGAAVVSRH